MSRGMPSMTALLALLAVAGYQHRDKIGDMLKGIGGGNAYPNPVPEGQGGHSAVPPPASPGIGGVLSNGLRDIVDRFRNAGEGETADSWVRTGPNREVNSTQLERALGGDTLDEIAAATGLTRADVLSRLSRELPTAVDRYTPDGRLPDAG